VDRSVLVRPLVLVAEDDVDDQILFLEAARHAGVGFDCHFVESGREVIDWIESHGAHPSLILLDVNMPRMDGFETLEVLRTRPSLSRVPIIFLSTCLGDEERSRAARLGALRYLVKPSGFDALVDIAAIIDEDVRGAGAI
jgi:CheY-like chemotaxis protein